GGLPLRIHSPRACARKPRRSVSPPALPICHCAPEARPRRPISQRLPARHSLRRRRPDIAASHVLGAFIHTRAAAHLTSGGARRSHPLYFSNLNTSPCLPNLSARPAAWCPTSSPTSTSKR